MDYKINAEEGKIFGDQDEDDDKKEVILKLDFPGGIRGDKEKGYIAKGVILIKSESKQAIGLMQKKIMNMLLEI